MIAVLKHPGQPPVLYETSGKRYALRHELGGWYNSMQFASDACVLFRDELRGDELPFNLELFGLDLYGPIVILGVREGEFCELRRADQVLEWVAERSAEGGRPQAAPTGANAPKERA